MGSDLNINPNPGSIPTARNLRRSGGGLDHAVDPSPSGSPLNSIADDAAGMSMSENMRAQQREIQQALRDASDAAALVQIAGAGYQPISDTTVHISELALEAVNGATSDTARDFLDSGLSEMITEIHEASSVSEHNNVNRLGGSTADLTFQIGARNSVNGWFDMSLDAQSSSDLGVNDDAVNTPSDAPVVIESLRVDRASMAARADSMNIATKVLAATITSNGQALGSLRDVDIGQEPSESARQQVLQAKLVAILTQANANTGMALRLLR